MKSHDEWMAETMQPILDRIAGGPMTAEEERDARARMALIDAAPDLLEALLSLYARCRVELADPEDLPEMYAAFSAIEKAIGKTK